MSTKPNVLATICARGGSKGVKGKNIRQLDGRPLIYYTLECVRRSKVIDKFIISTDSDEILEVVKSLGYPVDYRRPADLAQDDTPKNKVIRHATLYVEQELNFYPDIIADLDITVPLKSTEDIDNAIMALWNDPSMEGLITVYEPERNPYFNMVEEKEDGFYRLVKTPNPPVFCRQDAPRVYSFTPAVAAWKRSHLFELEHLFAGKWGIYEMPVERAIDIDTPFDFKTVEFLMSEKR